MPRNLYMSPAMVTALNNSSETPPMPRGVRRALDAMRANVGRDWTMRRSGRGGRHVGQDTSAPIQTFSARRRGQRCATCGSRRPPRTAASLPEDEGDGRRAALRLLALRAVFRRVSPPLRRDAVADAEAAADVRRCAGVDAGILRVPAAIGRRRPEPIEAARRTPRSPAGMVDELATALSRAGVAVASEPRSARYRLNGEHARMGAGRRG